LKNNLLLLIDFIRRLYKNRYMIRVMALRELKATYIGSLFGFFWAVINPLSQLLIYGIVFGIFFKSVPDPVYGTDSFLLFLLCGLIPWQFFSQTIASSTSVIVSNGNLIKKAVGFPSEVLPIVTMLSNLISHLIGVILLILILILSTGTVNIYSPLVFVYLFLAAVFAVGLGWMLASLNVYLRDVQQMIGMILMGWFFFTPVFYSPGIVPEKFLFFMKLNPIYHLIEGYRLALLSGKCLLMQDFLYLAVISFLTFLLGGALFRKLKPGFAEIL